MPGMSKQQNKMGTFCLHHYHCSTACTRPTVVTYCSTSCGHVSKDDMDIRERCQDFTRNSAGHSSHCSLAGHCAPNRGSGPFGSKVFC